MTDAPYIQPHRDGVVIDLRVQPRASRAEVGGVHAGALRVRVTSPPVEGAANAAVIEALASALRVRKSDIEIVSGASSRSKRALVRGISVEEARRIIASD